MFIQSNQSKSLIMVVVLFFGFLSGAVGGAITGYLAAVSQNENQELENDDSETRTVTVNEESESTEVVENVKPSVVSIVITKELQKQRSRNSFFGNPFFDDFQAPENSGETETVEICSGTGFVISEDGLILTNRHVICEENAEYTVVFEDGTSYSATVLGRDQFTDLAILKIEATGLTPIPLGDSEQLKQGQTVIAIGNALGEYTNSVTKGVVSGLSRDLGGNYSGLVQTDAAINEGNSGGPLINLFGEVVGINTLVNRGGEALGFAIPINEAKVAIESVKTHGRIVRAALGIRYVPIDAEVAELNQLTYDYGAYIYSGVQGQFSVVPGSAADIAGLQEGDIILEIDGVKIDEENTLPELIKGYAIGDVVKLKVYQDAKEVEVNVTLAELPQSQ